MKKVKVAILGFGTVGAGVYRLLTENNEDYRHREGLDFEITRVLVRDFEHEPNLGLAPLTTFTTAFDEVLASGMDVLVECMGGIEPARTFILRALQQGTTVVTSNKEVFSKYWPEFEAAAKKSGAGLYMEATAGGGIPIIRTLIDGMQANNIEELMGIVNGTTNYILTKMTEEGMSYDEALRQAQQLGYAEANPKADVEGYDSTYKLSILASLAFHARVSIDSIYREGITGVTPQDIAVAKELGYVIKLLAIGKKTGGSHGDLQVRVHPTMIPLTHPLAFVRDSFNAIFMHGHAIDDVMLYGRGAGQLPTASAIVSDTIYASKTDHHFYTTFDNTFDAPQTLTLQSNWVSAYAVRLTVTDQAGVLAEVAKVFGDNNVSIHSISQRGDATADNPAQIIVITHEANESAMQATLRGLRTLECVLSVDNLMRVEQ